MVCTREEWGTYLLSAATVQRSKRIILRRSVKSGYLMSLLKIRSFLDEYYSNPGAYFQYSKLEKDSDDKNAQGEIEIISAHVSSK